MLNLTDFWEAANTALVFRGQREMLYGEARDAHALYVEEHHMRDVEAAR